MRTLMLGIMLSAFATTALAGPTCTSTARDKWISEAAMKAKIAELGYKYKVFKVTSGNCYEIYGQNKNGQRVEVYFDPVSGAIHTEHKS